MVVVWWWMLCLAHLFSPCWKRKNPSCLEWRQIFAQQTRSLPKERLWKSYRYITWHLCCVGSKFATKQTCERWSCRFCEEHIFSGLFTEMALIFSCFRVVKAKIYGVPKRSDMLKTTCQVSTVFCTGQKIIRPMCVSLTCGLWTCERNGHLWMLCAPFVKLYVFFPIRSEPWGEHPFVLVSSGKLVW